MVLKMSAIEYNDLLFKVSQRLNELNVSRRLLVMCRGKVAARSEENLQDVFSLFEELEGKEFLGPDRLDVMKEVLEGLKEWSLLENVEKFEAKRKEFDCLLRQIIRALDELNDVERLVSICEGVIPQDRQGSIHDVRSLFEELKNNSSLGINRLDVLKEILTQAEEQELLEKVKEFEKRRILQNKFERRKGVYIEVFICYFFASLRVFFLFHYTLTFSNACGFSVKKFCLFSAQAAAIVSSARGGKIQ